MTRKAEGERTEGEATVTGQYVVTERQDKTDRAGVEIDSAAERGNDTVYKQ